MKTWKSLIVLSLIFVAFETKAQIILDKSTNELIDIYYLSNSGYKYASANFTEKNVKILNQDYSVWKTINLTVPANYYLYMISDVSENLFTVDGKVCLAYLIYIYNTIGQYYTYELRVVNENGTNLLTVPNAAYYGVSQVNTNGQAKLFAYIYDYSNTIYFQESYVYQLPGQLNTEIETTPRSYDFLSKAFPNPAHSEITIPYTLPDGTKDARLILTDMNGTTIRDIKLTDYQGTEKINTASFPSGVYQYQIITDKNVVISDKIIINK